MSPPLKVFCCYAREDQEMLAQLKKHLMPLQRQGQITIWSDVNLAAGVEWEKELHRHLESADLILLLISSDFMASDYCYGIEMKRAIERHQQGNARVVPILLRFTHWQNAPFARLQMIPTNADPVTNWPDRDKAFHDITEQIQRMIMELQTRRGLGAASRFVPERSPLTAQPEAIEVLHTIENQRRIYTVAFSPDGQTLASGGSNGPIKLWNAQTGQLIHQLLHMQFGASDYIHSVAFSPDGQTLASGGSDSTIKLWNVRMGQLLRTLTDQAKVVNSVAFSPDGQMLASGGSNGTIKLWNVQTGQLLRTLTDHTKDVNGVAFSPDRQTLASGSSDKTIRLWNIQTGQMLRKVEGHKDWVFSVAFSPDGQTFASGGRDYTIKLWTKQTGQLLLSLQNGKHPIWSVAFSPDGQMLASGSDFLPARGGIDLWNVQTGQLLRTMIGYELGVKSVAFSPDGQMLAGGGPSMVLVWGVKGGRTIS